MIIDSHCHLDFDVLFDQLDNVIKRADENDVKYLLTICTTLESFSKIKLITEKCKNIAQCLGNKFPPIVFVVECSSCLLAIPHSLS